MGDCSNEHSMVTWYLSTVGSVTLVKAKCFHWNDHCDISVDIRHDLMPNLNGCDDQQTHYS